MQNFHFDSSILTGSLAKRIAIALVTALLVMWFYPRPQTRMFHYEEGRPWNYPKLIAPFDIPIHPDSATLQRARDTLDAHFVPVYRVNQRAIDSIIEKLPVIKGTNFAGRLAERLRREYSAGVVDAATKAQIDRGKLPRLRILEKNVLSEVSTRQFVSPGQIYGRLDSTITDPALHQYFAQAKLPEILTPNVTYDQAESRRHYDYDYQTLTADRGVIQQGQTIIDHGNLVTAQDFTNLHTYEEMMARQQTSENKSYLVSLLGHFLYIALLLAILMLYMKLFTPSMFANFRAVLFVYAMVALFFLLGVGMSSFIPGGLYILPMTIAPILVVAFYGGQTALIVSFVLAMVCAPVANYALEFIFLQLCASAAAVFSLRELSRRSQLLQTACVVAVTYIGAYLALELMMNGSLKGFTWRMPAFLVANALLTSMVYLFMFVVERVFGFVSTLTLVELADTNTPLLRELGDSCPGTFQHSMAVSNLASDAARAMGANEQLVRAGALYHDIGKMTNPAFFTENQHGVNPHDALTPEQSARIVINHISDGLRRAEKAGLPAPIKDFIREHHGAGRAKYFYFTACKNAEGGEVDPAPFTYPGPNPRTRETSLLMMADAVEAASRSLKEYTRESITDLVNKIVDGQIADGLHAGSTLEFRDVPAIKDAFVRRLMTIYHTRVAYPKSPEETK